MPTDDRAIELLLASGDPALRGRRSAAEFVLRHRVVRSERTGSLVHESFAKLHYPTYWHYDVLAGLRALSAGDCLDDPRAAEAVELLESRRRREGTWKTGGKWWRPDRPGPTSRLSTGVGARSSR